MINMQKGLILTLILFVIANVSLSAQTAPNFTFTDTEGVTHDLYDDYLNQEKQFY